MDINLAVSYKDGSTVDITVEYVDCIAFERKFNTPVAAIVSEVTDDAGNLRWRYDRDGRKVEPLQVFRAEHLAFLAWSNQSRTKATEDDFDAWLETLSSVELAAPKAAKSPARTRTRSK